MFVFPMVFFIILIIAVAVYTINDQNTTERNLSPVEGERLIKNLCNNCHSPDRIYSSNIIGDQWFYLVGRMVLHNGAQISPWQNHIIAEYLAVTSMAEFKDPQLFHNQNYRFLLKHKDRIIPWLVGLKDQYEELDQSVQWILYYFNDFMNSSEANILSFINQNHLAIDLVKILCEQEDINNLFKSFVEKQRTLFQLNNEVELMISETHAKDLYEYYCQSCHGRNGVGGIGPKLSDGSMLQLFNKESENDFYIKVIRMGRPSTQMPPWGREYLGILSTRQLKNIIYLFEIWHLQNNPSQTNLELENMPLDAEADLEVGEQIFASQCSQCHGPNGEGDIGPGIKNYGFCGTTETGDFVAISNAALRYIIKNGRGNTMMPAFSKINNEQSSEENPIILQKLEDREVDSVIQFLRENPNPTFYMQFF